MDIVVVGSVALDSISTPYGSAEECLGGSASYAALAASYFTSIKLVAVVGEDFPESARGLFRRRGIDCAGLEVAPGKTFRWGGRYHKDMNHRDTLFTQLNVFEHFHPKLPPAYRDAPILFLANIHPALQLEVFDQISRPRLVAVDTMNLWIETALDDLKAVLARADLVFVNEEEARQLTGHALLPAAVAQIRALGPRWVVVKKGEHGALLFTPESRFAVPAVLLERVFDPTGAGDAFAGGFLGHLARAGRFDDEELRRAMGFGTVLASFTTEHFSVDRITDLTADQIRGRCAELHAFTRWTPE
jgi:sugar/nucleoside kinase (ribokinase family)